MAIYNYRALKSGNLVDGKIEANSLGEAREALRKQNLTPTKIIEQSSGLAPKKVVSQQGKKNKNVVVNSLNIREKIDFTNTLYILQKTGISIVETLLFMEMNTTSKKIKILAAELRRQVLAGSSLSEAVSKHPGIFDQIFLGLIKAGEESGELEVTLERVIYLLDKQDKLRSKIIGIVTYPCIVIFIAIAVTLIMLAFVFPAFKDMYDNMGDKLPWITQTLMDAGLFLKAYWFLIPIIMISLAFAVFNVMKWPFSKRIIDQVSLKIPLIKTFVQFVSLSNFLTVLKVAFDAGVPIIDALLLANLTIQNYIIKESFINSTALINRGQSLTSALKATNTMPGIVLCMISTGEQAGSLGSMLDQAGFYIDTQLERVIDTISKFFEPALMIVIGGVVMVLALALYLPLFQSYSNMM
jgi:type II secretory pathway component PulF